MGRSEITSMLFRPIIRWPFQSIDEYREDTLMIGSPMVFQTAPPQPASKARITCSPQLVGGAEASQNGFGLGMPANVTERSGTGWSGIGLLEGFGDSRPGPLPIGHGVHHFPASVDAVASRIIFRVTRASSETVNFDPPHAYPNPTALLAKRYEGRLPDGRDDHVACHLKVRVGNWLGDTLPIVLQPPAFQ